MPQRVAFFYEYIAIRGGQRRKNVTRITFCGLAANKQRGQVQAALPEMRHAKAIKRRHCQIR